MNAIMVTGGAGFIGSNFVRQWLRTRTEVVVNFDKLTYAGNPLNLAALNTFRQHKFVKGDVGDRELVRRILNENRPFAVVHFAAESHVDRSITGPEDFVRTNVLGTSALLEETRAYWEDLTANEKERFRFLHVSTDEVYGSLTPTAAGFHEGMPFAPNSPYAASKAASDHLVRAFHKTYGLPTLTTNCSNNYGPFQFPEKLIPFMILNALDVRPLPLYGDGMNVRDWLYVEDHCEAICAVLARGRVGQTYNIGGCCERSNLEVVNALCSLLDEINPSPLGNYSSLITFVTDRPGHDRRYAVDIAKIRSELGWVPKQTFELGLRKTVQWYLGNREWVNRIKNGSYRDCLDQDFGIRTIGCGA